jgi:hypothetical protein
LKDEDRKIMEDREANLFVKHQDNETFRCGTKEQEEDDVPLISLKRAKCRMKVLSQPRRAREGHPTQNDLFTEIGDADILGGEQKTSTQTKVALLDREKRTKDMVKIPSGEQISTGESSQDSRVGNEEKKNSLEKRVQRKVASLHEVRSLKYNEDIPLASLKRKKTPSSKQASKAKKSRGTNLEGEEVGPTVPCRKRHAHEYKEASEIIRYTYDNGENVSKRKGNGSVPAGTSKKKKLVFEDSREALTRESCTVITTNSQMLGVTGFLEIGERKLETMPTHQITDGKCQLSCIVTQEDNCGNLSALPMPPDVPKKKEKDNHGVERSFRQSVNNCTHTPFSKAKPAVVMADTTNDTTVLAESKAPELQINDDCPVEETDARSSNDFPFDLVGCNGSTDPPEIEDKEAKINSFLENAYGFASPIPHSKENSAHDVAETDGHRHAKNLPSLRKGIDDSIELMPQVERVEIQDEPKKAATVTALRRFRPTKKKIQVKAIERDEDTKSCIDQMSEETKVQSRKQEKIVNPTPKDDAKFESDPTLPAWDETRFVFHASDSKPAAISANKSKSRPPTDPAAGGNSKLPGWFLFESQQDAEAEQERLLRASAARVRTQAKARVISTSSHGTTFSKPVVDVHRHFPDHWQYVDLHARLGLPRNATDAMIKTHYRRLALVYHPDRNIASNTDTKSKFQAVTESYHLLMRK